MLPYVLGALVGLVPATVVVVLTLTGERVKKTPDERRRERVMEVAAESAGVVITESAPKQVNPVKRKLPKEPAARQRLFLAEFKEPERFMIVLPEANLNNTDPNSDEAITAMRYHTNPIQRYLSEHLPLGGAIDVMKPQYVSGTHFLVHIVLHLECHHDEAVRLCEGLVALLGAETKRAYWVVPAKHLIVSRQSGSHGGRWVVKRLDKKIEELKVVHTYATLSGTGYADTHASTEEHAAGWADAVKELDRVTAEFASYEFNPRAVMIERPLLRDLNEPATARFYDAFGDANALRTDSEPDSPEDAAAFIKAVERSSRAWDVANDNALRKGEQNISSSGALSTDQVSAKHRAAGMLDRALDENTPEAEAALSWTKTLETLNRAGMPVPPSSLKRLKENNELVQRAMKAITV